MVNLLDFSHGGNVQEVERKTGKKMTDFSASINPLGLPRSVKKNLLQNWENVLHYPDTESRELKKRIGCYWGVAPDNILLGNGSAELIYLACFSFKPRRVFIPVPAFSEYERASRIVGSKVSFLKLSEENSFSLAGSFPSGGALFLCNPNNPTGNLVLEGTDTSRFKGLTIIDEAFMDFLPDEKKRTLIYEAVKNEKIIVLRTFTKFFALPGLRIGYLVACKKNIDFLKQYQVPWNTNVFAQVAASLVLDDEEYIQKTRTLIKKEREFLMEAITGIKGLKPFPSVTNFILVKIEKEGVTATSLRARLIDRGLLVRDCGNFRNLNNRFIRVAVRNRNDNRKLTTALKKVLNEKPEVL
ncbi:MAG: threonine-phosphate decarboxylase [Candidatus Ratteibacteria bacterium]|jgi:threonine-phosphate decarboxylase